MSTQTTRCLNCLNEVSGKFCSECGQSNLVKTIHFKDIMYQIMEAFKPWENKWGNNLKQIMINPGVTARRYVRGERTPFFQPVNAFIFIISVYLILAQYFDYHYIKDAFGYQISKVQTPEEIQINKAVDGLSIFFDKYLNSWYLLFVIVSSIVCYFFFKKTKLTFGEHIIFNIIVGIGELIIFILFIPLAKFNSDVDTYVISPILLGFNYYAFYQFYKPYYSSKNFFPFRIISQIVMTQTLLLVIILIAFCFAFIYQNL